MKFRKIVYIFIFLLVLVIPKSNFIEEKQTLSTKNNNDFKVNSIMLNDFLFKLEEKQLSLDELLTRKVNEFGDESKEFICILDSYRITAKQWKYTRGAFSGQWHTGVDYASQKGSALKAPINLYILKTDSSCRYDGNVESRAGKLIAGGGNIIIAIGELDNTIYGFIFMHCNTVDCKPRQFIKQGEQIATVGKTGCAEIPHCHLEMILLGNGDLFDYTQKYYREDFYIGRGATAYYNRCESKKKAPCSLNPLNYIY